MTERLVATTEKPKSMKRRPGSRVRFRTPDGVWHEFLNEAVPSGGPLIHSLCDQCGHGYSELIQSGGCLCAECKVQEVMDKAAALEAQGIEMGAGTMRRGASSHTDAIAERMLFGPQNPSKAMLRW